MDWRCACHTTNSEESKFCTQCGAPKPTDIPTTLPAAPPPRSAPPPGPAPTPRPPAVAKKGGWVKWVALLLGVLLVFCVIASAVTGFIFWRYEKGKRAHENKLQVARQWAAELQMDNIGAALASYRYQRGAFPDTGHSPTETYSLVDAEALAPYLVPDLIPEISKDPWEHSFEYGASADGQSYVLICKGSDGANKLERVSQVPVTTHCFEDEIVIENGDYMQKPGGDQKSCK